MIEDILKAHTDALNNHAAVMEKFLAAGGTKAAAASVDKAKPAADKAKANDKPAARTAGKKTEKALVDQIADVAGEYLKAGDADDRKAAVENVKAIVAHFGSDRLTNIDPEHHVEVLAALKRAAAGEDLGLEGDGDEEEEGII